MASANTMPSHICMYIANFDVDFISTNDDLAENALKMANQAHTDFSLSIYRKNKALQKCMKSKWISKAFSQSFFFALLLVQLFFTFAFFNFSAIQIMWLFFYRELRIFGFSNCLFFNAETQNQCAACYKNRYKIKQSR